jgi:Protein of unknown function (DUF2867)
MRVPNAAHTSRPWRIHELVDGFRLEDVWELDVHGGAAEFPELVELVATFDPAHGSSRVAGALWAARWWIGGVLGWDSPEKGIGKRVPTLRERLPADLRDAPIPTEFDELPFRWLYVLDDECAAEIANETVHGIMHIGWVPDRAGSYRAQMAVYVKPNGLFGNAYMAAIRPFRHLIVYPPMTRDVERAWRARVRERVTART